METLIMSTSIVAIAEMGDKTQLLSFVLAAKFKNKLSIILGILFATLANHFAAGYVGAWLASLVSPQTLRWIIALSFFAFGAWALVPDKLEENRNLKGAGVFLTTLIAFFIVEIGDTLAHRINMKVMRLVAAALFVVLGILALFAPSTGL